MYGDKIVSKVVASVQLYLYAYNNICTRTTIFVRLQQDPQVLQIHIAQHKCVSHHSRMHKQFLTCTHYKLHKLEYVTYTNCQMCTDHLLSVFCNDLWSR